MGFEDRDYYQDSYRGDSYQPSYGQRSMIMTIIIINAVIFVLDMFTPQINESVQLPTDLTAEQVAAELEISVEEAQQRMERLTKPDRTQWLSYILSLNSSEPWKVWGFLTHGFAHASFGSDTGIMHILFNMITLFFLGRSVEQRLGRNEFLKFYLIAILVSGTGWLLYHWLFSDQPNFIVGASGAVSAVTFYFILMDPKQNVLLWGVLGIPAWALGLLFFIGNMSSALNPTSHIAWQAHFAGALFGVACFRLRWNFGRLNFGLGDLFKNRPKLKIHDPDASDEKLKAQADAILAKINEEGEKSLTNKERKILNKWSERLRKSRES